jgi:hypothetical protein
LISIYRWYALHWINDSSNVNNIIKCFWFLYDKTNWYDYLDSLGVYCDVHVRVFWFFFMENHSENVFLFMSDLYYIICEQKFHGILLSLDNVFQLIRLKLTNTY